MVEAQCAGLPCVVSDRIPREVALTDLVSFVSLNDSLSKWVERIDKALSVSYPRETYADKVIVAGYDIKRNAQWLQNYYLEQWRKTAEK